MRRPLVVIPLVVVVALSGCVPAEPVLNTETGEGLDAVVARFDSLDPDAQLAAIATHDARAERELWRMAGIDSALGGEDAADAAFAAMQNGLRGAHDASQGVTFAPASFRGGIDDAIGGGLFGNMLLGDGIANASIDNTDGSDGADSADLGGGTKATVSSEDGAVTGTIETHGTFQGMEITTRAENVITPCPDAEGKVHAEGTYNLTVTAPDGSGIAQQIQIQDDIVVDDDANIASSSYSYDIGYADSPASGASRVVELSSGPGGVKVHNAVGPGAKGSFLDDAIKTGAFFAAWIANSLEKAAKKGWESGRCIRLDVSYSDGPTGLDPDSKVTLTVSPIAKSDGRPAGGTVTAELTAGTKSVSPEGEKVKANATFTYTAPGKKDESGTVHLESRSKRGVGRLDATLDTKKHRAYKIVPVTNLAMTGVICDLGQPFDVAGGGITSHHTPTGTTGGTYTLSGSVGGTTWTGSGTYTVSLSKDETAGTMVIDGTATGQSPVGTITNPAHEVVGLIATDPC